MIEVRLSLDVLGRARFAYAPLAELAYSLRLLAAQGVHPLHQPWYRSVRGVVGSADLTLLGAVCPPGPFLPDFLFAGTRDPTTTIEQQLAGVAEMPAEQLRDELRMVWTGQSMPAVARQLVAGGAAGSRRLADALWEYWQLALEAYWPRIRSALDDDVSYRAARLTTGALYDVVADLHPEASVRAGTLWIDKPHHADEVFVDAELAFFPSVFAWPRLIVGHPPGLIAVAYSARGAGRLWEPPGDSQARNDALGALLGRSRAAILARLGLPRSTTQLAEELGQSPPAVSQHLSVLRRSGLVTARRSGRSVLYRRTALASSLVAMASTRLDPADPGLALRQA